MSDMAHERSVKAHAAALVEARKLLLDAAAQQVGKRGSRATVDVKRLGELLDKIEKASTECEETLEEYVNSYNDECRYTEALDEYVDDLSERLTRAVADRTALLRKLGLTDAQWSAVGGACETDFDGASRPTEG